MMKLSWMVLLVMACGAGIREAPMTPPTVDFATAFAKASQSGDVATLRKMLGPHVTVGGLWFPDAVCEREFLTPGEIGGGRLDELARCLTTLKLTVASRKDSLPDVAVLTYEPGLEIEARFQDDKQGPWLSWIGFEARRNLTDGLPTISPDTLESLRTAGLREPTVTGLDEFARGRRYANAWVKICIDTTGKVTGAHVREASSMRAAHAFVAAIGDWAFKPFAPTGTPMPVCSLVLLGSPLATALSAEKIPLPMNERADGAISIAPTMLTLVKGTKMVFPDDRTKFDIQRSGYSRIIGSFEICLDTTGHVTEERMLRSTGFRSYDDHITATIAHYEYEPYLDEGKPVPVCTALTFVYSQH